MKISFKKLDPKAVMPGYSKPGDAGMDLTAISKNLTNNPRFGYIEYGTGLAVEIPAGYVGLLFPRSSVSTTGLILANSVGVIDSGYRGEIKFRYKWIKDTADYNVGDRVGQLIILPYPTIEPEEVQELNSSERGEGNFGSSGK